MKKAILIFSVILLASCARPLNKSIYEPLPERDVARMSARHRHFLGLSDYARVVNQSEVLIHEGCPNPYQELTYKRLLQTVGRMTDSVKIRRIMDKAEKEWRARYSYLHPKIDSVSDYWREFRRQNFEDKFLSIRLADIQHFTSQGDPWGIVNLGFEVTPLVEGVSKIVFGYNIVPKTDGDKRPPSYNMLYNIEKELTEPRTLYFRAPNTSKKTYRGYTIDSFLDDYYYYIYLYNLYWDGKEINSRKLGIPDAVSLHWMREDYYHAPAIAEKFLNEKYIPRDDYQAGKLRDYFLSHDSLSYVYLTVFDLKTYLDRAKE